MALERDMKQRAQRIIVPYHKKLAPFRRWDRILTITIPLIAFAWVAWAYKEKDESLFNSGPVSVRHAFFEQDCAQCHDKAFSPVSNAACESCHDGPQHHGNMVPASEQLGCAECHVEHGGVYGLERVTDRHCNRCHTDLKIQEGSKLEFVSQDGLKVNSVEDGHPEFWRIKKRNLIRVEEQDGGLHFGTKFEKGKLWGGRRGETMIGEFADSAIKSKTKLDDTIAPDEARIGLNHKKHMELAITERDWNHPERVELIDGQVLTGFTLEKDEKVFLWWRSEPVPGATPQGGVRQFKKAQVKAITNRASRRAIRCIDCHQTDSGDKYMLPINYEKHCRDCHLIEFASVVPDMKLDATNSKSKRLNELVAESAELKQFNRKGDKIATVIPHSERWVIRTYTEDVVRKAVQPYRNNLKAVKTKIIKKGRRKIRKKTTVSVSFDEFVAGAMKKIEDKAYKSCYVCHDVTMLRDKSRAVADVVIPKPNIPRRWFPRSFFDHASHRVTSCASCHAGAGGDHAERDFKDKYDALLAKNELTEAEKAKLEEFRKQWVNRFSKTSSKTSDVLMPNLASCLKCHKVENGANGDCVECHLYHDKKQQRSFDGERNIESLVNKKSQAGAKGKAPASTGAKTTDPTSKKDGEAATPAEKKDGEAAKPAEKKDGEAAKPAEKKDGEAAKPAEKKDGEAAKPAEKKDGEAGK